MKGKLTLQTSVTIYAPAEQVWKTITTPELIKQYLFGTTAVSDWKEGSSISYQGMYNDTPYKDKGTIKEFKPNKFFSATYWSSMGGKEDKPENYNLVSYLLKEEDEVTTLTLMQDNIATEEEKKHATTNWQTVLKELKKVAENL